VTAAVNHYNISICAASIRAYFFMLPHHKGLDRQQDEKRKQHYHHLCSVFKNPGFHSYEVGIHIQSKDQKYKHIKDSILSATGQMKCSILKIIFPSTGIEENDDLNETHDEWKTKGARSHLLIIVCMKLIPTFRFHHTCYVLTGILVIMLL
jgi:hypothetical protein